MNKKDLSLTLRKCPVCFDHHALLLAKMDYCGENGLPLHYDIVRCASCSMIYNDFSEADADFNMYYQHSGKYSDENQVGGGGLSDLESDVWRNYFKQLLPYMHSDCSIIDVGCGKGGFLQTLKQHGFNNLWAVEPSAQCVEKLCKNGINAFQDWQKLGGQKFDIIVSSAVFEHLVNPREMLDLFCQKLTDNGILMLSVPDASSYCKYTDAPFYYFDREHINHFTIDSLKLLCSIHSFVPEMLHITKTPNIGQAKFYHDILGVFKRVIPESTATVDTYISRCNEQKKCMSLPDGIKDFKNVFLWGIGAYAENLLFSGMFDNFPNVILLDKDISKQGSLIYGKTVYSPQYLMSFAGEESAVIITSVLYRDKIISELKEMNFSGKYFTF